MVLQRVRAMTVTSKAGSLNSSTKSGFTLIELMVVLAVMGTVLFITLPKLGPITFGDQDERGLNLLLNTVRYVKKKAQVDGVDYTLHIDAVKSVMWVTSAENIEETSDNKSKDRTPFPESLHIKGVEIYGFSNQQPQEDYRIGFSMSGYCDMALIHLKQRGVKEEITVVIEPFLPGAEIRRKFISFDQCS